MGSAATRTHAAEAAAHPNSRIALAACSVEELGRRWTEALARAGAHDGAEAHEARLARIRQDLRRAAKAAKAPARTRRATAFGGEPRTCEICLEDLRAGDRVGALPCRHALHEACLAQWFDTGAATCPVCRHCC